MNVLRVLVVLWTIVAVATLIWMLMVAAAINWQERARQRQIDELEDLWTR